jgi:hypothetical protein
MIAYSRPKKVEVFYYTGDTPEWAQWQLDNNVTVKHPQVSSYVIINGGGVYYMTDKDFHEEYDVPRDVSGNPKEPYIGAWYPEQPDKPSEKSWQYWFEQAKRGWKPE